MKVVHLKLYILHFPDPELNILREELHDSVSSANGHDVNIPEENMLMQGRRWGGKQKTYKWQNKNIIFKWKDYLWSFIYQNNLNLFVYYGIKPCEINKIDNKKLHIFYEIVHCAE